MNSSRVGSKYFLHKIDVILLFVMVLGLTLRLYSLTSKGIWFDEANSVHFTFLSWSEVLNHHYSLRPVYFLLLKLFTSFIGTREYALRFISVLIDVCSISLIYFVAKELFNQRTARISAFLYSLSCLMIIWAQQIRNYSLGILLTIASFYLFIKFIRNKNRLSQLCLINITLALTTGSGILILIAQNLIFFLNETSKSIKRKWIVANVASISILALFFIYSYVFGNLRANWLAWIPRPNVTSMLRILFDFSFGGFQQTYGGSGFIIDYQKLLFSFLLVPIFLAFFLKALIRRNMLEQFNNYRSLLLIWFLSPLVGLYLFSYATFSVFFTRYMLISFPPFILIIAKGIGDITKKRTRAIVLVLVALLMLQSLSVYYSIGKNESLKDLVGMIKSEEKPEDLVALVPAETILPFMYYYLGETYEFNNKNAKISPQGFFSSEKLAKNININGVEIIIVDALNSSNLTDDYLISRKIKGWDNYDVKKLNYFDDPPIKGKIFSHEKIWAVVSAMWVEQDTIERFNERMSENYLLANKRYFRVNNTFLFEYEKRP